MFYEVHEHYITEITIFDYLTYDDNEIKFLSTDLCFIVFSVTEPKIGSGLRDHYTRSKVIDRISKEVTL